MKGEGRALIMEDNLHLIFARDLRQKQTDVEKLLWAKLRDRRLAGTKFRRQHPIGNYIVDFVSLDRKLVIELDGGQHNTKMGKLRDKQRVEQLQKEGYKVLRFWNNEVLKNFDGTLEMIYRTLTKVKTQPSPPPSPLTSILSQRERKTIEPSPFRRGKGEVGRGLKGGVNS